MASRIKTAVFDMEENGVHLTSPKRLILLCMSEYGSPEGFCWYSKDTIAHMAGLDPATAQNHIVAMQAKGRVRVWEWRNPNGRQGANVYKIELPGLAPATEASVKLLRSNRAGEPLCGWEKFRTDLGLPAVAPKPCKTTVPQESARTPETDPPQTESRGLGFDPPPAPPADLPSTDGEGGRFGESRDLGFANRGTSDPEPPYKEDLLPLTTTPEKNPSPKAIEARGKVEEASTPGEGVGSRQENTEPGRPDEGPKSEEAIALLRALYGREGEADALCMEARKFLPSVYSLVGKHNRGELPFPWGRVLEIAGDVRERHHSSGGKKPHHRASAFLALVALAIERVAVAAGKADSKHEEAAA